MNTEDLYDPNVPTKTITLFEDLNYWTSYHVREFLIANHYELFLYSMGKSSYTFVNLPNNYPEIFYKSGIIEFYRSLDTPSYFYMIRDELHSILGILGDSHSEELLNIISGNHKILMGILNMGEKEFFKDVPEENLLGVNL